MKECKSKAYPQGDNFTCVDHDIFGEPLFMYSVNTIISDGSSSIEAVFFNEAITNIIHTSCRDMVMLYGNKNPKVLPDTIRSITETSKLLHINMKKDRTIVVNRAEDAPTSLPSASTQSLLPKTPDPKMLTTKRALHEPSGGVLQVAFLIKYHNIQNQPIKLKNTLIVFDTQRIVDVGDQRHHGRDSDFSTMVFIVPRVVLFFKMYDICFRYLARHFHQKMTFSFQHSYR
ncbi:hypothetical protein E3N88_27197 [Mikania micrantha]|uniref:Replication factor A C-terminal domain-containing protein n=1 Tax=Mikania micrantha TaxID=192012 RepID=A0A5N6MWV9_9ASTR|nr:hypothetical protein E3N88_27197 [Mikania micrantha]